MALRILEDPIGDARWSGLIERHHAATVFHTPGWLAALKQTYGFEPFVLTSSPDPKLDEGIVCCRVTGWTGRRWVSLPFSDHCEPLLRDGRELPKTLEEVAHQAQTDGCRSVELRPRTPPVGGDSEYFLHRLDLRPAVSEIFDGFHPSNTQRAIRRAEREGLEYDCGTSPELLNEFYGLLRLTRRRHGLPPQPRAWFQNLVSSMGDRLRIHVARKNGQAVASLVTLSFKQTLVYKYGGSDATHHKLGGMPFLFWRVIQDARAAGFIELDLGRSDRDQAGLIAFKEHLGATRSSLSYYRSPAKKHAGASHGWMSRAARNVFAHLPDSTLDLAGKLLYRHFG